ncbi:MAG: ABC transporter substrate-binding protein [Burkholderiales bacterium]
MAALLSLAGCSDDSSYRTKEKTIRLWVAPSGTEEHFWKIVVERWNRSNLGARVEIATIPTTGGSEEAILTALVSGSNPDLSTNIYSGFAAQLAQLGQLQDISAMPQFQRIVEQRQMSQILQDWQISGQQYVMPLYSNPVLIWWRADILADLGVRGVPQTYADVYALSRRRATRDGHLGMQVLAGREWRDRWFDYLSYYYANGNGAPYIKGPKAFFDNQASLEALNFIRTMLARGWSGTDFDTDDPLARGLVAGAAHGPWDLPFYQQAHPETLKKIVIGPMLRSERMPPPQGGRTHTLADSKGMVLFRSSKVQPEALQFMSWVFSNDDLSLLWLEATGMPPARGDLMTNPMFTDFYRKNPLAAEYASYVDVAKPPVSLEESIDVHKILDRQMIEPIKFGTKSVRTAARDATRSTERLLARGQ